MKRIVVLSLSILILVSGCRAHSTDSQIKTLSSRKGSESNSKQHFPSGDISVTSLKTKYPQFFHQDTFNIDSKDIKILASLDEPIAIVTYFGLWCHDSKREVPKLLWLLEKVNNRNISHQLIALDTNKAEGQNRQDKDKVKFTPTIIVKKSSREFGRIIEKPQEDLAKDLIRILNL